MNAITHFLRLPVAILSIVWCFGTFIILNSYSSTLTSYLLIQRYHPMVNSIEDIANMKRPVIMVSKFGSYETTLMVFNILTSRIRKQFNWFYFFIWQCFFKTGSQIRHPFPTWWLIKEESRITTKFTRSCSRKCCWASQSIHVGKVDTFSNDRRGYEKNWPVSTLLG